MPFGGCTEPSNVKAGGQACPIRFQCSGCPFYRPDPSYLPAMQDHINSLRAERETAQALGSARFVIDNLGAQIASYQQVADTMRARLDELSEHERRETEQAALLLRRLRAAATAQRLLPVTDISATR